jgi:hypothetical protein
MQRKIVCLALTCLMALFVLSDVQPAQGDEGFKLVRGEGSICASGHGAIQFHGNGTLAARVRGGQLIINDESAVVSITGNGKKHVFPNGWVMYIGYEGKVRLEGEDIFGQIIGKGLRMKARGEGVMLLMGKGVYRSPCKGSEEAWEYVDNKGRGIDLNDYAEFVGNLGEEE